MVWVWGFPSASLLPNHTAAVFGRKTMPGGVRRSISCSQLCWRQRMKSESFPERTPQVFVVDDDRAILRAFSRLLGSAGFSVKTFESPAEFLGQHDPEIPGCALLDVGMH